VTDYVTETELVPTLAMPRLRAAETPRVSLAFGETLFELDAASGDVTPRGADAGDDVRPLALDVVCFLLSKVLRAGVRRVEASASPGSKRRRGDSGGVALLAAGRRVRCFARLHAHVRRRCTAQRPSGDSVSSLAFEKKMTEEEDRNGVEPLPQPQRMSLFVCQDTQECKELLLLVLPEAEGSADVDFVASFCKDLQSVVNRCELHNIDGISLKKSKGC